MQLLRSFIACSTLVLVVACPKPAPDSSSPPENDTSVKDGSDGAPPGGTDPCAGVELPACPSECSQPPGEMAGSACTTDGEKCGNSIGDGCECTAGKWECTVHAPLGPGMCNSVCR